MSRDPSNQVVVAKTVSADGIYCKHLHTPQLETNEIFVKGLIACDEMIVRNPTSNEPVQGITSDGNFILTDTCRATDWDIPFSVTDLVINGNRVGQLCTLHFEITSSTEVPNGSVLFSKVPESFNPHTRVVGIVSIWDDENRTFSHGTIVFEPLHNLFYFYGTWLEEQTLMGTITFFRA